MIYCFGDSHVRSYNTLNNTLAIYSFTGASAKGLNTTKSTTNTNSHIKQILHNNKGISKIFFQFGQVDIDYILYLKHLLNKYNVLNNTYLDEYLCMVVHNYFEFINSLEIDFSKIIISSINPPCISDKHIQDTFKILKNEYNYNIEDSVINEFNFPSLYERTHISLKFNNELRRKCELHNLKYCDIFNSLVNSQTQTINTACLTHELNGDSHLCYDNENFSPECANILNNIFDII